MALLLGSRILARKANPHFCIQLKHGRSRKLTKHHYQKISNRIMCLFMLIKGWVRKILRKARLKDKTSNIFLQILTKMRAYNKSKSKLNEICKIKILINNYRDPFLLSSEWDQPHLEHLQTCVTLTHLRRKIYQGQ